ncbi:MAG: hypothetical protein MUQ30_16765, partial [Anaerolineae bacterium]|nr:hypothetical protein [Anaerolineae bacterium]
MTEENHFSHCIVAGNSLKPWLILGPFYEDLGAVVQGLTLFEKSGATVGVATMEEIVTQARPILASVPEEGVEVVFRDQAARWSLVRRPEEYLSWGSYNISNHLGAAFLTTTVQPEKAGTYHWHLSVGISLRALVAVDGEVVYDTALSPVAQEHGFFVYPFEASLAAGDTRVTVALFRLGRMAQVGCRLELDDAEVAVLVPLGRGVSERRRQGIEEEVNGLRLER